MPDIILPVALEVAWATKLNTAINLINDAVDTLIAPAPGSDPGGDAVLLQTLLNAVPAGGAVIHLPAGNYECGTTALTCSNPVVLVGSGAGTYESGGTRIRSTSSTGTLLTLDSPGFQIRDLTLENTSGVRPTAGAGLLATDGDFSRIARVMVIGFWNCIQYNSGYYYDIADSTVLNPRNYGMYFRNTAALQFDHSDQSIHGCTITKYGDTVAGGTAVQWESGGGLRFVDNKINGGTQPGYTSTNRFSIGLHVSVADGGSTSVFVITGNSIENCTGQHVRVDQAGTTGDIGKIVITGNEIAIGGGYGVWIDPAIQNKVYGIVVSGNVFTDLAGSIYLRRISGAAIGTNIHRDIVGPILTIETGSENVSWEPQNVLGDNRIIVVDNTVGSTTAGPFGQADAHYDREIPTTTSAVTYTQLYRLTVPQDYAGIIEVALSGNLQGVGGFSLTAKRFYSRVTGAVTVTTIGTDAGVPAANTVDFSFDVATTSGDILIKVRKGAGGTSLTGRINMRIIGAMYSVKKGT